MHFSTPRSPDDEAPWPAIAADLAGRATDDDRALVAAWLAGHPARGDVLAKLQDLVGEMKTVGERTSEERWKRFLARASEGSPKEMLADTSSRRFGRRGSRVDGRSSWRPAVFASMFGAVTCIAAFSFGGPLQRWIRDRMSVGQSPHAGATYTTRAEQRADISLPNGGRLVLAPQSTLTLQGNVAVLTGEAFFTLPHQSNTPFIVRTGRVSTRVLGTAFDVRRYAGESETRVVVLQGKVSTGTARAAIVSARMAARVSDSAVVITQVQDTLAATDWTRGQLVFHDAAVRDVLAAVSRWYGLVFRLSDSTMMSQHLTTTLDVHRTRNETLAAIETGLEVRLHIAGDTIIVLPRRRLADPPPPSRGRSSFTPLTEVGR